MLWGGLLMIVGTVMLFNFLDRTAHRAAAVVCGIGFGLFVDELGKFITSDNNYFFRPASSIIYIVFVLMFMAFRALRTERHVTDREYLANAIEAYQQALIHDFDRAYLDRARHYLAMDRSGSEMTHAFADLLDACPIVERAGTGRLEALRTWVGRTYSFLSQQWWFDVAVLALFATESLVSLGVALYASITANGFVLPTHLTIETALRHIQRIGDILFAAVAVALVIAGAVVMVQSRLQALRLFRLSILVSIFLTEVFAFYDIQFDALYGVAFNVLGLLTVNTILGRERARVAAASRQETRPPLSEASARPV
jgi:hypothetical protein